MGKVLKKFTNGFTGAVSRSNDTIIISVKNASGAAIPREAPPETPREAAPKKAKAEAPADAPGASEAAAGGKAPARGLHLRRGARV